MYIKLSINSASSSQDNSNKSVKKWVVHKIVNKICCFPRNFRSNGLLQLKALDMRIQEGDKQAIKR